MKYYQFWLTLEWGVNLWLAGMEYSHWMSSSEISAPLDIFLFSLVPTGVARIPGLDIKDLRKYKLSLWSSPKTKSLKNGITSWSSKNGHLPIPRDSRNVLEIWISNISVWICPKWTPFKNTIILFRKSF